MQPRKVKITPRGAHFSKRVWGPREVTPARNPISSVTIPKLYHSIAWESTGTTVQNEWTISWMNSWSSASSQPSLNWNPWKHIQNGLPAGRLSFLLRTGSDTLPTPLNLNSMLETEDRFQMPPPVITHGLLFNTILNGCPVASPLSEKIHLAAWQCLKVNGQWLNERAPTRRKAQCWPTWTKSDWQPSIYHSSKNLEYPCPLLLGTLSSGFVIFAHFSLKNEAGFSPRFSSANRVSNTILT